MSTVTTLAEIARRELSGAFEGTLVGPGEPGYEEARRVYNAMIDRRPGAIARCTSPEDVAAVIGLARRHGLPLAVRGGGHNGAGLGVCDDGVVADLSPLEVIQIDPAARTARVGGGCTWGEVDRATHAHGLATPAGIISTTGVGGLTLGGGHGHLTRLLGLTIDNLLEAELVLADGSRVTASESSEPDLFWAIRGGGGNFGVATSFTFRLHPVSTVVAGPTLWPLEQAPEVLRWYREFLPAAPRELNGFFAFLTVPPVDPFPKELHLRKVCGVVWCYAGPTDEGERALAAASEVGTPLLHGPHELPYPALQSAFDGLYPPGLQWYWRGDFLTELPDEAVARHAEWGERLPTMHSTMHLYPVDGAPRDVASSETAFSYREAVWSEVIVGVDPDPAKADLVKRWTVDYWDAVHPYSAPGAYVNFLMDEGVDRVRATYRDNYARLARVKAAYDPDNVFRVNQNIAPAGE